MSNIIRSIRLAISRAVAPATVITPDSPKDLNEYNAYVQQQRTKQYAEDKGEVGHEPIKGTVSCFDVQDLVSDYAKSGICTLGSWSALARAYNLFLKNPKSKALDDLFSEFHAWNAVNPQQMDEEAVLTTVAKLTVVKPAKGSQATDEIIARVRKCTVAELTAQREAKAKLDTAKREAVMEGFITSVWAHVYSDGDYKMQAAKAESKLISVMEWVAGWNSSNPAGQAAELLLLESDLSTLRTLAKQGGEKYEEFVDGTLTADHMMQLTERRSA